MQARGCGRGAGWDVFVPGIPVAKIIIIKSLENETVSYHCLGGSNYAHQKLLCNIAYKKC